MKVRQNAGPTSKNQEMSAPDLYGHDAWLCVNAICDESGSLLFGLKDIDSLNSKSGEAIGYIAKKIIEFSDMTEDVDALESVENNIKNLQEIQN